MSRRAPIPDLYHQLGDVYILHLDPPYKHAAHYSGFSPENSGASRAASQNTPPGDQRPPG